MRSAFGHASTRLAQVTDGLSNTVFTAETLQGQNSDVRGAVWTLAAIFMTRFTPNGVIDYYGVPDPSTGGGDRLGAGFCVNDLGGMMPCTTVPFPFLDLYSAARSRHPGGVNAGFGDGSVHFMKNSINPVV